MKWMVKCRRIGPFGMLVAAAVAVPLLATPRARAAPEVMSQAGSDAEVVLTVPNLQQASNQIAALKQSASLPGRPLGNLLGMLQQFLGVQQGLNARGGMAVSVSGLAQSLGQPGQGAPQVAILLPVSDYGAFAGNFDAGADGVSEITIARGQPGYIRQVGDYALLAKKQSVAENYEPTGDLAKFTDAAGSLGGRYLDESDISLWVDMGELRPALQKKLEQGFARERADIEGRIDAGAAQPAEMLAFEKTSQAIMTVVENAQAVVAGLDVNEQGLGLSLAMQQGEQSALNEYLSGEGSATELLKQLPNQPFLLAMAVDSRALAMDRVVGQMQGLMQQLMQAQPDQQAQGGNQADADQIAQLMDQFAPVMKQMQGVAQALYVPDRQAMMSGGAMQQVAVFRTENPEQFVEAYKQSLQLAEQMAQTPGGGAGGQGQGAGPPGGQPQQGMTTTYEEDATTVEVGGEQIQADRIQVQMNLPPQAMRQMGPMAMLIGGGNQQGYLAVRENYVVITASPKQALLQAGLESAGAGEGLGTSAGFTRIADRALPPNPVFAGYISVSGIGQVANQLAPMMGLGGQGPGGPQGQGQGGQGQGQWLNVPDDLSPAAIGLGVEGNGLAARLYLPADSMQFVSQTVRQKIMPMMMRQREPRRGPGGQPGGPMGPGGPGGPPGGPGGPMGPGGPPNGPGGPNNAPSGPGNPPASPPQGPPPSP